MQREEAEARASENRSPPFGRLRPIRCMARTRWRRSLRRVADPGRFEREVTHPSNTPRAARFAAVGSRRSEHTTGPRSSPIAAIDAPPSFRRSG
jgi:hypothetical protein